MVAVTAPPVGDAAPDIREMDAETLNKLYPPKLEPMPDAARQFLPLMLLAELIARFLEMAGRQAFVSGDSFIYYRDEYGFMTNIAPDLYVALGIRADDLGDDRSYYVERIGKPPELVMEIGSPSTAERDVEEKPRIYAHIGSSEYWLFDPEGGDIYGFKLMGLRLVDGEYVPIELDERQDGTVRGYSEALGLFLVWDDGNLQIIDPKTNRRLRSPMELVADERAARRRAEKAEAELAELRRRLGDR